MPSLRNRLRWYVQAQKALALAALLATAVFYAWCYRPNAARLRSLSSELSARQLELRSSQARAAEFNRVSSDIAAIETRLAAGKRLAPPDGFNAFIDIPKLVRHDAGSRLDVAWGQVEKAELFSEQPVNLTFVADFASVFAAIRQLEDLPQLTRIRAVSIRSIDARKGIVNVTLSLSVYSAEG
jgi:hypothetical protein